MISGVGSLFRRLRSRHPANLGGNNIPPANSKSRCSLFWEEGQSHSDSCRQRRKRHQRENIHHPERRRHGSERARRYSKFVENANSIRNDRFGVCGGVPYVSPGRIPRHDRKADDDKSSRFSVFRGQEQGLGHLNRVIIRLAVGIRRHFVLQQRKLRGFRSSTQTCRY